MHSFSTDQSSRYNRYILIGAVSAVLYLKLPEYLGLQTGLSFSLLSTALYIGFTKGLWKWELLHTLGLVKVPNLNGTWEGHLFTSEDVEAIPSDAIVSEGEQIDDRQKIETRLVIKQTWNEIRITLDGEESPSHSNGATMLLEEKAWPTLSYNYRNEGGRKRDDVDSHYGTASLEYIREGGEDKLVGRYFNDPSERSTHGSIKVARVDQTSKFDELKDQIF